MNDRKCTCALNRAPNRRVYFIYSYHFGSVLNYIGMWQVVMLAVVTFVNGCCSSAPCYDHQNVTYKATFEPAICETPCTVIPFFSPDTSVSTYVNLIESATEAIDIFTPGKLGLGLREERSRCTEFRRSLVQKASS